MKNTYKVLKKVIVGLVGLTMIIIGVILLPLPGPGWLVILLGLVILSSEFDWAKRLRDKLRAKLDNVVKKVKAAGNKSASNSAKSAKNTDGPGDHQGQSKD